MKTKRKWMYAERSKHGVYIWFSDCSFRGYKTMTLVDFDNECNLELQFGQFFKVKMLVKEMVGTGDDR